jgi:TonB family protein
MPRPAAAPLPGVVTVDLVGLAAPVAGAKPAARAATPAPAPREAEPTPPAPKPVEAKPVPAPVEAPKPEPPKPEPPKPVPAPPPRAETILPKKAEREPEKPKAKPEPKPEPEPPKQVAKATPPKPPTPPKPTPPKQESYDDLLAELRAEHGESKPAAVPRSARAASASGPPAGAAAGRSGAPVDPEFAGWARAVQIHLSRAWILPPEMKSRKLMTELLVDLDAQGNVLSEPRIVRGSGDARFDDNAVRAVKKASPLPPPPAAGVQSIQFCPECA